MNLFESVPCAIESEEESGTYTRGCMVGIDLVSHAHVSLKPLKLRATTYEGDSGLADSGFPKWCCNAPMQNAILRCDPISCVFTLSRLAYLTSLDHRVGISCKDFNCHWR